MVVVVVDGIVVAVDVADGAFKPSCGDDDDDDDDDGDD